MSLMVIFAPFGITSPSPHCVSSNCEIMKYFDEGLFLASENEVEAVIECCGENHGKPTISTTGEKMIKIGSAIISKITIKLSSQLVSSLFTVISLDARRALNALC